MLNYNWRGNVRELQHVIERAILLSKGGRISELNIPKNLENSISFANISKSGNTLRTNSQIETEMVGVKSNGTALPNTENLSGKDLFEEIGKFIVEKLPEPGSGAEQNDVFNSLENGVVLAALRRTNGNKQAAANLLGLYRPRLYGMIKRHNLDEKI